MVLTVDIGNSNIVIGAWDDASLKLTGRFQTRRDYSVEEIEISLNEILSSDENVFANDCIFEGGILSSVVPEITEKTLSAIENIIGKRPLLMGPFLHTGVDISDYAKDAIGMDRIVDLSAALAMYGAPVMVCDLGTCTTITVAGTAKKEAYDSKIAEYDKDIATPAKENVKDVYGKLIGGMICPGVQLSLDAEAMRASQLPQLKAGSVNVLLGKDTSSNMMAGAVAGTGLMISALAHRIMSGEGLNDLAPENIEPFDKHNESENYDGLKVVVTGGLSEYVMPWIKCRAKVHYEENLLLRGLYEIYVCNSRR